MWKFEFEAPVGLRCMKGFWGVCVWSGKNQDSVWWCEEQQKWVTPENAGKQGYSTHHHGPKSFKAFKRYLRKHPELKGHNVELVHRDHLKDEDGYITNLGINAYWEEEK